MAKHRYPVQLPKPTGRRRAVELCKDLLILVLTCSAVYLAGRSQLYAGLGESMLGAVSQLLGGDKASGAAAALPSQPTDAVRPVRIAFCTGVTLGDARERCGLQYDTAGVDSAFDSTVRRFLAQALSGAGAPVQVGEEDWRQALQAPGIYLDLLGSVPVDLLAGWLGESAPDSPLPGSVRRLVLADRGEPCAVLYYINEEDGLYYACQTPVAVAGDFTLALSTHSANGARFAFEAGEAYSALAPDTLLSAQTPSPPVYQGSSPIDLDDGDQRASLQALLGFRPAGYQTRDGWVNDTLHISRSGTVTYDAREVPEDDRYGVAAPGGTPDLDQAADMARTLLEGALSLGANGSEGRICLLEIAPAAEGRWEIRFGYTLSGAPVEVEGSLTAARFLVEEGRICAYELKLRQYQAAGTYTALLPQAQAAAAMAALEAQGRELTVRYTDPGGDAQSVQADWAALE